MRPLVLFAALLVGCLTPRAQLEHDAADCDSFAEFDARAKEQLDALLTDAPGDTLVRESSKLNALRKQCARHAISHFLERREDEGLESVQRELDALTAAYGPQETRALLVEVLGPDVKDLDAMLEESRTKTARAKAAKGLDQRDDAERKKLEVRPPDSMGPAPEMPDTMCDEPTPCAQFRCVASHPEASSEASARKCLDAASTLEPQARAEQLAEVLSLLPSTPGPSRTDARMMLETLQRQRWPEVEKAVTEKKPGRAAQLASPFVALPSVKARVEQLRDAAKAHHLARAKELEKWSGASWLHRSLAHQFGGPEPEPLPTKGTWKPTRWLCKGEPPTLPELPAGFEGTLTLRCATDEKSTSSSTGPMRTFELEGAMRMQEVKGTLVLGCGGKSSNFDMKLREPGVEGFPEESLRQNLQRVIEHTQSWCQQAHRLGATASCAELSSKTPAEITERFVTHARFTRTWERCFVEWLEVTEGVGPPAL